MVLLVSALVARESHGSRISWLSGSSRERRTRGSGKDRRTAGERRKELGSGKSEDGDGNEERDRPPPPACSQEREGGRGEESRATSSSFRAPANLSSRRRASWEAGRGSISDTPDRSLCRRAPVSSPSPCSRRSRPEIISMVLHRPVSRFPFFQTLRTLARSFVPRNTSASSGGDLLPLHSTCFDNWARRDKRGIPEALYARILRG